MCSPTVTVTGMDDVDPVEFHQVQQKLRSFFIGEGYCECYAQNKRTIMAACEDPKTMAKYLYSGSVWPLIQTNQMHLEVFILNQRLRERISKNPSFNGGLFCNTTSYRQEPNPVPGRHNLIFPMFEFEAKGTMEDLLHLEGNLLKHLGFPIGSGYDSLPVESVLGYPALKYNSICEMYGVDELEHSHEQRLMDDYGHAAFITDFPEFTDPFWNMARKNGLARKVDVICSGQETIGSAERSTDKDDMRQRFMTISNGEYAGTLFGEFTRERTMAELDDYLSNDFFARFGGGIGVTRLIRSLKLLHGVSADY